MSRIVQADGGFVVSGAVGGKYYRELYLTEALVELSAQRRSGRATERAIRFWMWVKPGVAVYSQDGQQLGKIAEVRGRAFKIGAPFLQRDYWLPGESIASVVPDERIVLSFPLRLLDAHKRHTSPPHS